MLRSASFVAAIAVLSGAASFAAGQVIFQDDFDHPLGPSPLWSNVRGQWTGMSGAYGATQPNNNPLTYSGLPFVMDGVDIECDIRACNDGGIMIRSDAGGNNGVLFVLARGTIYWHNIVSGQAVGLFSQQSNVYTVGQDVHVRIVDAGGSYTATVNGRTSTHSSSAGPGRVGLYDFTGGGHDFDNVVVRGECFGAACCALIAHQPADAYACRAGIAQVSVDPAGTGPFAYQWQLEDPSAPGGWRTLLPGPIARGGQGLGSTTNTTSATLEVQLSPTVFNNQFGRVRALVTGNCGTVTSDPAFVIVRHSPPCCDPDFNQDGNADQGDVDYLIDIVAGGINSTGRDPDFNQDGNSDQGDIDALIDVLAGGDCP